MLPRRSSPSARSVLLAVLATLLVAGCGTASVASAARRGTTVSATAPTEAGNRRLARQEAIRLLAEARVPADAVRVHRPPHGLSAPISRPPLSSVFVRSAFWTVRSPFATAVASAATLTPAGLVTSWTSTGSGPHLKTAGIVYAPAVAPAWGRAEYEIDLSRLTAYTTGIRVDAVTTWSDPTPARDTATGPRLRVTVGAPCPAGDRGVVGVRSPGPHLGGQLVYRARPTGARVCSYSGSDSDSDSEHPFTLTRSQILTAAQAQAVATAVTAVSLAHTDGAAYSCPADFDRSVAIALSYPGRPDVDLWYGTSDCSTLANGHVTAFAFDARPALAALGD